MRNLAHRITFAATIFFLATAAVASSVIPLTLSQLRARADVVVHARVLDVRTAWEPRGWVTYTKLVVVDADKGAKARDELVLYQPGNAALGDGWVDGAHVFHVGDEVVLFGERFVHADRKVVIAMAPGAGVFEVHSAKEARDIYAESLH